MPGATTDQGITVPIGGDAADDPVAFNNFVAGVEPRLVRLYTNLADRVAKRAVVAENEISGLASENRVEVYDGTNDISLFTRSLFAYVRKTSDQNVGPSNTTLQNVTDMVVALPTASGAIFGWRATIFYDAAAAADMKFAFTIPTGATMRWGLIAAGTATFGDPLFTTSVSAAALGAGADGTNVNIAIIEGELTLGANPGNLQLQAAQNASVASAANIYTRSRMMVWRSE
jgi:hypothetical protein